MWWHRCFFDDWWFQSDCHSWLKGTKRTFYMCMQQDFTIKFGPRQTTKASSINSLNFVVIVECSSWFSVFDFIFSSTCKFYIFYVCLRCRYPMFCGEMDYLETDLNAVKIWAPNSKKQKSYSIFKIASFFRKKDAIVPREWIRPLKSSLWKDDGLVSVI